MKNPHGERPGTRGQIQHPDPLQQGSFRLPAFFMTGGQSGIHPAGNRLPHHPTHQEPGRIDRPGSTGIRHAALQQIPQNGRSNGTVLITFPQGKRNPFRKGKIILAPLSQKTPHQHPLEHKPRPGLPSRPASRNRTPGHKAILNAAFLHSRIRTLLRLSRQSKEEGCFTWRHPAGILFIAASCQSFTQLPHSGLKNKALSFTITC